MTDDERTDAALLAAASGDGDHAAFATLVRRHIRSATLLATQLLGDQDDADDVVQDAFTVVYRQAHTFDGTRPFAPWFYAIVRRLAAKQLLRTRRRRRLLRWWSGAGHDAPAEQSAVGAMEADTEIAAVQRAMAGLSPMQRACFELVVTRDVPAGEVAAMHGISESTVRQHVFRARAAIRRVLDGHIAEQNQRRQRR